MNAWDVDSNLQLSTYAEIGHTIVLLFKKLRGGLVKRIVLPGRQAKGKSQQQPETPSRGKMPYCCMTPFNEMAENYRLYYPFPHVF